ncbi:MAG: sulfite exporter TauE/SafE family protein [Deltaproteobacteria bacterium]|nr:sulfite exporter TauE/SafE family protein [Deltaproteobacteria bacterium]MBI3388877.1 sulfite exporter TauE/SafE family protein [Deltaproteobacteria bacterium]
MTLVLLGLVVGTLSGILGLGGGIFLVPALIFLFDFTPHQAQGTSLGVLIPPVGIFAALEYYRRGYIDFSVVGLICVGFVVGAYAGAFVVDRIPVPLMRRLFGFFMFFIAVQMVFTSPDRRFGSVFPATVATGVLAIVYLVERRLGLALPRVRRYVESHKPKKPMIEYNI